MEARLEPGSRAFEFGGGGSTLWLQERVREVICVEHQQDWYEDLNEKVSAKVDLRFVPPTSTGRVRSQSESQHAFDDYVAVIADQTPDSFDLVVVDGRARIDCVEASVDRVRPGGLLLLDDSDRESYAPAHQLLSTWEPHHFRGLKPAASVVVQTSVWVKPADSSPATADESQG